MDLLAIAIEMEKRGAAFYDVMSRSSPPEAGHVFRHLVEMERAHIQTFENLRPEIAADIEGDPEFVMALMESMVFPEISLTGETALAAGNYEKSLELAIGLEKDSILFYYELKGLQPSGLTRALDRIIGEEKAHLSQLLELQTAARRR
ncbi:MAG: ferritin family protein [Chloroflexi bacterium]|nr:ferritin family protein [Chloroflexota bacterium]